MRRGKLGAAFAVAVTALLTVGVSVGLAGGRATDGGTATGIDFERALVQLAGEPLATYEKTKPPQGKKIDFSSSTVKSYRAHLSALRNDFKKWLRENAPDAKVTGEYDIALNAVAVELNGTSLSTIQGAPMVQRVEYQGIYTPQVIDPDLTLINAFAAWAAVGGGANAGKISGGGNARIKVGVVDTGIDATHPCFDDAGFPATQKQGPPSLTNNKVIVAKVFHNKAGSRGYTPAPVQSHGTHVAGTVACNYGVNGAATTTVDGVTVGYGVNGVAPAAQLGNYNVFPDLVGNARSEDILNALDAAYQDGMDIVNMSLGGVPPSGRAGIQDLLSDAVDDFDQAGMLSAISAGNSGPGFFTLGSPGTAARALTAGAVTVGHYIGVDVTNDTDAVTYGAAVGQFGPSADTSGALTANLGTYCGGGGSHTGKIALIDRGACTFSTKIRNAQNAGAVGALIVNNVWGPPIAMAQDGTPGQPTIPGVMASKADRAALSGAGSTGDTFTIHSTGTYVQNLADNGYLAGFSSRGPTDVDFRIKPDVTAPGVNVLSSIPNSGPESCVPTFTAPCWAFFQGTSMSAPHLAGSAAVLLGAHPGWAPWQVRSAVVNTADAGVFDGAAAAPATPAVNVLAVGSGLENLNSALNAKVALDPVSVSFGGVPSGAGRTDTRTVSLANLGGAGPYSATVTGENCAPLVDFSAAVSGMTVTVTMDAQKLQGAGFCQGILRISNPGGEVAHAAIFAFIK
jgi:subtilisin family serine protease